MVSGFICVVILSFGYAPDVVFSLAPPAMTTPPLLNSGVQSGDVEITNVIDATYVNLAFNISFLGLNYNKLFISADGTVGFEKVVDYFEDVKYFGGVRNAPTDVPFIAPLLYKGYRPRNMDSSAYQGKIRYRVVDYTKLKTTDKFYAAHKQAGDYLGPYLRDAVINPPASFQVKFLVVVTWDNVAEAVNTNPCTASSLCKGTSFQIILAGDLVNTFAIFNYGKFDITVKDNYEAGFNAGRSRGWYNVLPCHGGCATYIPASAIKDLRTFQGSDLKGRYIFSLGQESVTRGGCLPKELVAGILEVYPRTVGMFGGEKLEVSGLCGTANAKIYCKFGNSVGHVNRTVVGAMVNTMKGYCPVPLLSMTGLLDVYWSNDNKVWTADQSINVALPSRHGNPVVVDQKVSDAWFRKDSRQITVKWNPAQFGKQDTAKLEIKLIGYKENVTQVEYRQLMNIGTAQNNQSSYTFEVHQHRCTRDCEDFEIGLLEVSLPLQNYGLATDRVAVRFGPIPLGWYVNEELEYQRGSDWSNQKCIEWHEADSRDKEWIKHILPCPCNLDQALADFGRWQADPGCNLFTGSQCHYQKGAKHCVLAVVPTKDGSGNQCCYNQDGTLRHSQISYEGSTPDRSHAWGAYPYNTHGRVPELSHWKHDVVSFYYCCLWNSYELCDLYMQQRPTADCRNYDVPGIGFVSGHTHVTTFDGLTYDFAGSGDFWLAQYDRVSWLIQGKFQPRAQSWDIGNLLGTSPWKPKALTAVAMSSGSKKIEVRLTPEQVRQRRGLDIIVDGQLKYFLDKASSWQAFQDVMIINNAPVNASNHHDNFTFLLTTFSVGVNVVAVNGLLQVAVAVPSHFKPEHGAPANVIGVLGTYDVNMDNDLQPRRSVLLSPTLDKKTIFDKFVLSWKLEKDDYGIFKYDTTAEATESAHTYFEYSQIPANFPGAPNKTRVAQFCGSSTRCMWDFQITGDESLAKATKDADLWIKHLQNSAYRLDNCGMPDVGIRAILTSYNFSVNHSIEVTGCGHGINFHGPATFRCLSETLEEARKNHRAEYGTIRTDNTNKEDYIIHWSPKPYIVCSASTETDVPLIVGIVLGVAAGITIAVVVAVILFRRWKGGKLCTGTKEQAADRGRQEEAEADPPAAENLLSETDDSPSTEPVPLSPLREISV